jgi:hypothetical protein
MREARYVSLIPRTTLHSDSEQYPFPPNLYLGDRIARSLYYNADEIYGSFRSMVHQWNRGA